MMKNNLVSLTIMLIVCTIIQIATCVKIRLKQEHRSYYWHGHNLAPKPHNGYHGQLEHCINELTDKCGKEMSDYVFYKKAELSKECCNELINSGNVCSKQLSKLCHHKDLLPGFFFFGVVRLCFGVFYRSEREEEGKVRFIVLSLLISFTF